MGTTLQHPVLVPEGSGKVLKFLGVTHKVKGDQNGEAYYLCEAVFGMFRDLFPCRLSLEVW